MKPKNKLQRNVLLLSSALPPLSREQWQWATGNVTKHYGFATKHRVYCTECGERFSTKDLTDDVCPKCGQKLEIVKSAKRKDSQRNFFASYGTLEDGSDTYQYQRVYEITREAKVDESAYYRVTEVRQQWVTDKGDKQVTISMLWSSLWSFSSHGTMEVRATSAWNPPIIATMPECRLLEKYASYRFIVENGLDLFAVRTGRVDAYKAEILIKGDQRSMLDHLITTEVSPAIHRYWKSINICIRNHYSISDASLWLDYCQMLDTEGKDLRNAHYVCPKDLHEAHNIYLKRERARNEKIRAERKRQQLLKDREAERRLQGRVAKLQDLVISNKDIKIVPLATLADFAKEADTLHHCVFSQAYYDKPDSLILSARVDGRITETIEISLATKKIVQCRGAWNRESPYHRKILALTRKHLSNICQLCC